LQKSSLANEEKDIEWDHNAEEDQKEEENLEENDDDEDLKKKDGIEAREIGPDGIPLYRNPSDLMNNFFINVASIAFTGIQKDLQGNVNSQEIKRLKRYEKEINQRKVLWLENTVGMFEMQTKRYEEFIKSSLKGEKFDEDQFMRENT